MHRLATPCLCGMCVKRARQLGSGPFSPYITIERVSFAPTKAISTFISDGCMFPETGGEVLCIHSLTHWCILFYNISASVLCQIMHAHACTNLCFLAAHSVLYFIRAGIFICLSSPQLCYAAATGGHWRYIGGWVQ